VYRQRAWVPCCHVLRVDAAAAELGEDHPDTISAMSNLGTTLGQQRLEAVEQSPAKADAQTQAAVVQSVSVSHVLLEASSRKRTKVLSLLKRIPQK
jgi:hypothetical protein